MKSITLHTVDEVFGITRNLPLNYVERRDVDGRLRDELDAAHHVVIYGSSKQGKEISSILVYGEVWGVGD